MNSIISTWRVISGRVYDAETGTQLEMNEGSLHYDRDGSFAAHCVLIAAGASVDEEAAAARYPYSYAGRYEVDAARGVISHQILSSSFPDEIGTTVLRRYQLSAQFLSVAFPVTGSSSEQTRTSSYGFISLKREVP